MTLDVYNMALMITLKKGMVYSGVQKLVELYVKHAAIKRKLFHI
jgi:hypothetical protein